MTVRYNGDGTVDTSFGSAGKVLTPIGTPYNSIGAVVLQPDGKLVAAGYAKVGNYVFALVRYNADGSLDTSFGNAGKVTTALGTEDSAQALVLQPDAKLVAAGYTWNGSKYDFALARYNSDGSFDSSFGAGGTVKTAVGASYDLAYALRVQPDGKLVAAGKSYYSGWSQYEFALVLIVQTEVWIRPSGIAGRS